MGGLDRGTLLALGAMALARLRHRQRHHRAQRRAAGDRERTSTPTSRTIQWVINAYALVFGVLIVTGGRLADMFGRRRLFFVGAAIFAAFSLLGGVAQDDWWLIVCRALMGIGGAIMWPAVLGMTYDALPEDKAGLAGGLILGVAGFGNAAGPLLGGVLTERSAGAGSSSSTCRSRPSRASPPGAPSRSRRPRARASASTTRASPRSAVGLDRAADRARPGDRLGLERPAHPRPVRPLRASCSPRSC